jgi:uncharacterized protein (DUF1015 family)
VILPHENTMAGPVADRLALMTATAANLEPIYLVYTGGGAASELVASVSDTEPLCRSVTPDGIAHRVWAVTDAATLTAVATDLAGQVAVIADGHHRYATYRQLQNGHGGTPGPWDRGLALLVDTSAYGPQVHAVHRVVELGWDEIVTRTRSSAQVSAVTTVAAALEQLARTTEFAIVLADSPHRAVLVSALDPDLRVLAGDDGARALQALDVSVVHHVLVERVWQLRDDEQTVGYAHSLQEALDSADPGVRTAVLLKPTPVDAVAAVAIAGGRMPRKSTLFTPKPASGLLIRRFADQ